jgi:hypothetical protein
MSERIQQEREARARLKREKEEVSDVVPLRFWEQRLIACYLARSERAKRGE